MKNMVCCYTLVLLITGSFYIQATPENKQELMRWMHKIIDDQHKKDFSAYYEDFTRKQLKVSAVTRKKNLKNIESLGRAMVHVKHTGWGKEFLIASKSWSEKQTKKFFTRCGVYEQFLRQQAIDKTTAWQKIRSYAWNAKNKVMQWVESWTGGHRIS